MELQKQDALLGLCLGSILSNDDFNCQPKSKSFILYTSRISTERTLSDHVPHTKRKPKWDILSNTYLLLSYSLRCDDVSQGIDI